MVTAKRRGHELMVWTAYNKTGFCFDKKVEFGGLGGVGGMGLGEGMMTRRYSGGMGHRVINDACWIHGNKSNLAL